MPTDHRFFAPPRLFTLFDSNNAPSSPQQQHRIFDSIIGPSTPQEAAGASGARPETATTTALAFAFIATARLLPAAVLARHQYATSVYFDRSQACRPRSFDEMVTAFKARGGGGGGKVSGRSTGFDRVRPGSTGFDRVGPGWTGLDRVGPGSTGGARPPLRRTPWSGLPPPHSSCGAPPLPLR